MAAATSTAAVLALEAGVECEKFLQLEAFMATEEFLERLIAERGSAAAPHGAAEAQQHTDPLQRRESLEAHIEHAISNNIADGVPHKLPEGASTFSIEHSATSAAGAAEALDPSASPADPSDAALVAAADSDGFVVIDRQAAVDAMATFIAESLMRCPQAFEMTPKKLQEAVLTAVQSMKQSRFRQLCRQGVYAYRWGAIGYSAFQVYTNPWLCQAILAGLVGFSRIAMAIR